MKKIIRIGFLSLIYLTASASNVMIADVCPGNPLPVFSVKSNQGKVITNTTMMGKPSVIVFFHTKCWDCRKELPLIQTLYEEYGNRVEFVCISREQCESEIAEYWLKHKFSVPYSAQKDKTVFRLFAERTIPRVYVCDANGLVKKVFIEGARKRQLQRAIRSVLSL